MAPRCQRCGNAEHARNGPMRGKRRDRCKACEGLGRPAKACGPDVTATPPRGKPPAPKVTAVLLHVSGCR